MDRPPYAVTFVTFVYPCKLSKLLPCLLYTSDAADDLLCVDLGGRRIIKKKITTQRYGHCKPPPT